MRLMPMRMVYCSWDDVINNGQIKTSDASITVFLGDYSGSGSLTAGPLMTGVVIMGKIEKSMIFRFQMVDLEAMRFLQE